MQALILAAGTGKRLGGQTPKCLIEIGSNQLIVSLIEQFRREGIKDVVVVTGFGRSQVEEVILAHGVRSIFNPFYPISDNLVSLWMGQQQVSEDCIVSHGDLIIENKLLKQLVEAKGDIILPLDRSSVNTEAMKILLEDERVLNLSKTIPLEEASGESIPLMKFSSKALKELSTLMERTIEAGGLSHYIEEAVLDLIKMGQFKVKILDVTGFRWAEIDTPDDLIEAKKLFP